MRCISLCLFVLGVVLFIVSVTVGEEHEKGEIMFCLFTQQQLTQQLIKNDETRFRFFKSLDLVDYYSNPHHVDNISISILEYVEVGNATSGSSIFLKCCL